MKVKDEWQPYIEWIGGILAVLALQINVVDAVIDVIDAKKF